jgi:hypothetical protein
MIDYRDKTPNEAPVVRVNWEDICFSDSWNEEDGGLIQPVESTTIGYLIYEDDTRVAVAGSYNWRTGEWASVHAFPKAPPEVVKG